MHKPISLAESTKQQKTPVPELLTMSEKLLSEANELKPVPKKDLKKLKLDLSK